MNERDMLCSSQRVLDLANGQQVQNHIHPEPCILLGSTSNFPRSHVNQVLPPSGNSFDLHHIPEQVGRPSFYGMTHYNQPNHPSPNQPNFFNGHLDPASGARVFPVPLNHGFVDQSPSSSNYGGNLAPFNDHGRSNYSTEGIRELCKRKSSEGIPGNVQHFGASAGPSSSSVAPMTSCHYDSGSSSMEAPLTMPDYRGNGTSPMMEVSGARNRSGAVGPHMDSGMMHNYNNFILQGSYGGQSFHPSSCSWLEQQSISIPGGLPWGGPPMLPYFQGSNVHGVSPELGNGCLAGYPERSNNHGSSNFLPSQPVQQHHNLHPSQNFQGVRGYGVACYPPFLAAPSRVSPNDGVHHDLLSISHENAEPTNRPTGIRIFRSQGRSLVPDVASRRRDLPRIRTLPVDGVAILEFSSGPYEIDYDLESIIDQHRDMRLDIDDMSYEELLALSERIGTVNTGLTEKDIRRHMKTRRYNSTAATINLEELPCLDQNNDSCIICQDEYEHNEKLGTLGCGHEYHAHCLKKWLLLKNVCPICKSSALVVG